jgi:hypothetical protein
MDAVAEPGRLMSTLAARIVLEKNLAAALDIPNNVDKVYEH